MMLPLRLRQFAISCLRAEQIAFHVHAEQFIEGVADSIIGQVGK